MALRDFVARERRRASSGFEKTFHQTGRQRPITTKYFHRNLLLGPATPVSTLSSKVYPSGLLPTGAFAPLLPPPKKNKVPWRPSKTYPPCLTSGPHHLKRLGGLNIGRLPLDVDDFLLVVFSSSLVTKILRNCMHGLRCAWVV